MCICLIYLQVCVSVYLLVDPFRYRLVTYFPGFLIFFFRSRSLPIFPIFCPALVKQRWPLVNMMMTVVQMPEMLLLMLLLLVKAVWPVSLFRSMLAASSGTSAIGRATVGTIRATVLMLLRMLVLLLQVQKMLLLMV